jgi:hypothetical protein
MRKQKTQEKAKSQEPSPLVELSDTQRDELEDAIARLSNQDLCGIIMFSKQILCHRAGARFDPGNELVAIMPLLLVAQIKSTVTF